MALAIPAVVESPALMSSTMHTTDAGDPDPWDAVVIGAGPAGAMAARELSAGGAQVLLVDRRGFPREKVCGGCLNGHALAVLRSAGLEALPERSGGVPVRSFRLGVCGRSTRLDLPAGMAVSRARFDSELVGAAVDAGVRFLQGTEARVGAVEGTIRTVHLGRGNDRRIIGARLVLAATGLGLSCLPADSSPRTRVARGARLGTGCFLEDAPADYQPGTIHMAVGKAGYVGLVRLGDGRVHVAGAIQPRSLCAVGGPGSAAALILSEAGFAPLPDLATARWQGTIGLTRRTHPLAETGLFVLGDAAGYVEPFTGEGIAWALAAGRAIGPLALRAIERWEPRLAREWEALHRRVVGRRQILCRAAAAVLRQPWMLRAAFRVVSRLPSSAGRFIDHLNAPPPLVEAS
jgi:flavin-dependent dehydrogenase